MMRVKKTRTVGVLSTGALALLGGCSARDGTGTNEQSEAARGGEQVASKPEPLWQGRRSHDPSILGIVQTDGAGTKIGPYCSGVAISPKHILTSARCLPVNATNRCGTDSDGEPIGCSADRFVRISWASDAETTRSVLNRATFHRHESYADAANNIGLLTITGHWTSEAHRTLSSRVTAAGDTLRVSGAWGTISQYDASAVGIQNGPRGTSQTFDVDFSEQDYFVDQDDVEVRPCEGDQGSPAFFGESVNGILSDFERVRGRSCRINGGDRARWTSIAPKLYWIEQRLKLATTDYVCPLASPTTCCVRESDGMVRCS